MSALYVLSGFAGALLSLAVLAFALGYLVRSLAMFLPPAGAFLGTVTELRDTATQQTSAQIPQGFAAAAPPWPTRRERGVAPPPVDTTSDTSAHFPPANAGDQDVWDNQAALDMLAQAQRPRSV